MTMLINELKTDFSFEDERGILTQISHGEFKQINAVFTKKNAVRGNWHYHKLCNEYFYIISGKIRVQAKLNGEEEEKIFEQGSLFMISKNVRHNFEYLEDTYLVVMYDERVELDENTKDIYID